ncbi:hypothetical protein COLO4_37467 [Corchorus olitorius]|uniref:Uncharacterized protein n=1 Tax=Corchorus olitorius TaxID=93759 RepID=A0A1R3G1D6_9ROSI|nr:hypothetical protein COLO4_37467 [Corchorus olitorius]
MVKRTGEGGATNFESEASECARVMRAIGAEMDAAREATTPTDADFEIS